jgi:hypothetical protein
MGQEDKEPTVQTLLGAWPKMSPSHRPDFEAFKRESSAQRDAGTSFRDAYMWPSINLEDLSRPKTILLFLQARVRNTPDVFAFADADAAHLGIVTKAIVPPFLQGHTLMLRNRKSPSTYGEVVSWDDDDMAFEMMCSGKAFHPGHGLLVLEIQQRVFRFLVDCCKLILHDIASDDLTSDRFPIQEPVQLTAETADGFASLAVMAAEAPYRLPANMDLLRLESLSAAKKGAADDHVWALREDPGYYVDCMLEYKDHLLEVLKDTRGHSHPVFNAGREDQLWHKVIKNVVANAHVSLEVWSELFAQVKELRKLQAKHARNISPEKDLPEDYLNALLRFQHYLTQAAKGPKSILKLTVPASPPLRQYFVRMPATNSTSTKIQVAQRETLKRGTIQYNLLWLLQQIWEDDHNLFLMGLTNVVDELERTIQSDKTAKEMLSPFVADTISDLTVISEALRQLKIYHPWASTFENLLVDKEEGIKNEFARNTQEWGLVMAAVEGPNQKKIVRLGEPEGKKFFYPIDKNRKKENVEALRIAEQNLDAFWSAVDQNMRTRIGSKMKDTALGRLLSQSRILQWTPAWTKPDTSAKDKADIVSIAKPLSELYFELEQRTERTIDRRTRVTKPEKTKTKGLSSGTDVGDEALHVAQDDQKPSFALDTRALKVFRTLFYTPSLNATPGEVAWTDFLHAMASTGFDIEKLYGSVWQFKPTKLGVERSIQFHEPHPSGKLRYTTARRFGRRLNRAYGWEGSMFVPKQV